MTLSRPYRTALSRTVPYYIVRCRVVFFLNIFSGSTAYNLTHEIWIYGGSRERSVGQVCNLTKLLEIYIHLYSRRSVEQGKVLTRNLTHEYRERQHQLHRVKYHNICAMCILTKVHWCLVFPWYLTCRWNSKVILPTFRKLKHYESSLLKYPHSVCLINYDTVSKQLLIFWRHPIPPFCRKDIHISEIWEPSIRP